MVGPESRLHQWLVEHRRGYTASGPCVSSERHQLPLAFQAQFQALALYALDPKELQDSRRTFFALLGPQWEPFVALARGVFSKLFSL